MSRLLFDRPLVIPGGKPSDFAECSSSLLFAFLLALTCGGSGGSRQSLGIAVVGGLLFSGFLTLFVVPAVYAIFSRPTATSDAK